MLSSKPAIHCWSTVKNLKNIIIHIFSKVKDIAKITRTKIGDFKDFKQQNLNKSIINKRALLKQKLINIYFWNGKRYPRNFNGFKLLRSYHYMYIVHCTVCSVRSFAEKWRTFRRFAGIESYASCIFVNSVLWSGQGERALTAGQEIRDCSPHTPGQEICNLIVYKSVNFHPFYIGVHSQQWNSGPQADPRRCCSHWPQKASWRSKVWFGLVKFVKIS